MLQSASNNPRSLAAYPSFPPYDLKGWNAEKPEIKEQLEQSLYGQYPENVTLSEIYRGEVGSTFYGGKAKVEIYKFELLNPANGARTEFNFVLILPTRKGQPAPLILTQNFCPNHNVVPIKSVPVPENLKFSCDGDGIFGRLMYFVFGRYIVSPPIEDIIDKGYAIGVLHPPEFIADSPAAAQQQLAGFFSNYDSADRPGALISWAMQSVLLAEFFGDNPEISEIFTWGHSRYAKTALLAGAYSNHIDGVISHQSGTGGASLFRDKPGETLNDIIDFYPHWFGQSAQQYIENEAALPLDQHYLLALLAPRPVLLGNARRDVWSDPEGAFRAGKAATSIYRLYGSSGLIADQLGNYVPEDDISFWIRRGTHGVVKEDWPAFLKFLDAHSKKPPN